MEEALIRLDQSALEGGAACVRGGGGLRWRGRRVALGIACGCSAVLLLLHEHIKKGAACGFAGDAHRQRLASPAGDPPSHPCRPP